MCVSKYKIFTYILPFIAYHIHILICCTSTAYFGLEPKFKRVVVVAAFDAINLFCTVCVTHYGHKEDGDRLNLSRRLALRVAQMACNSAKSSGEIFQTLAGGADSGALTRDAVKSVIGYVRRNGRQFDYPAWQKELLDVYRTDFSNRRDYCNGAVCEMAEDRTLTNEKSIRFTRIGYNAAKKTTGNFTR